MKKITSFLLVCFLITTLQVERAHALFGVGDIVFDPTEVAKTIMVYGKEAITSVQTTATAINTFLTQNKLLVLDPIQNGMIAASLLSQQKNTLNLVTGALGGQKLLQQNPDQWIQNQGLNAVRVNLSSVQSANGLFSGSILSSLSGSYRASSDVNSQLKNLSISSIPNLVQTNACKDANLTSLATQDVLASNPNADANAINVRKAQLYGQLCQGNPQTDLALARRLAQVNTQRPDVAGDAAFYAYLSGDNAYARSVRAANVVAENKANQEASAKDELNRGGGVVSPSKCDKTVSLSQGDIVNIANAPCAVRTLTGSGSQVQSAFQQALNAPMQKLVASDGWGILSTLTQLLAAKNTVDMMRNAFGSSQSSGTTNTPVTTTTNTKTQDLTAGSKNGLTDPISTVLTSYSQSLSELEAIDNSYASEVSNQQAKLGDLNSCYQSIMSDYSVPASDPRISPGLSFYQSQMNLLTTYQNTINADRRGIQAARAAIASLQTLMQSSNSSSEINTAYNDLLTKQQSGIYPQEPLKDQRDGQYSDLVTKDSTTNSEGGDLYNQMQQCTQVRASFQPSGN